MDFVGKAFSKETVVLDDNTFTDCTFEDVVLEYSGGVFHMSGCSLKNFRFHLDGNLARGLGAMHQLAKLAGPKEVKKLVDFVSGVLRNGMRQ